MNEPHDTEERWNKGGIQAGIDGIREADPDTLIIVPGDHWDRVETFGRREANGDLTVWDPSNNFLIEAHVYFDHAGTGRYGGGGTTCAQEGIEASSIKHVDRVQVFVDYLRRKGYRGFLGEYGIPAKDPCWLTILDRHLAYILNAPELVGGTYWLGGAAARESQYNGDQGVWPTDPERPQMAVLSNYPTIW